MKKIVKKDNIKKIKSILNEFDNMSSEIGWFSHQHYKDGTPVAYVAQIHEFGAPQKNIPPRPFMRPTGEKHHKEWAEAFKRGMIASVNNQLTPYHVFEQIGSLVAGQIADSIKAVTSPPLKYKQRFGNQSPLRDTKQLFQSVTNKTFRRKNKD